MTSRFWLSRIGKRRIWERILRERLSEPLHLNLMSLFVGMFGSLRAKIYFDLLIRQHHAFGLLNAANKARRMNIGTVSVLEFGVANGAGLLNICEIAGKVARETGVQFRIYGFDTGTGMPPARDYRDHPEHYQAGDFPMERVDRLRALLPEEASLIIGNLGETAPEFLSKLSDDKPVGFVSIDVDYYWSTVEALRVLEGPASCYLPTVTIYLDDICFEEHNSWCGELAAVENFNSAHPFRKIERFNNLRSRRLFKKTQWIDHMFSLHVLDHPWRSIGSRGDGHRILDNPYL